MGGGCWAGLHPGSAGQPQLQSIREAKRPGGQGGLPDCWPRTSQLRADSHCERSRGSAGRGREGKGGEEGQGEGEEGRGWAPGGSQGPGRCRSQPGVSRQLAGSRPQAQDGWGWGVSCLRGAVGSGLDFLGGIFGLGLGLFRPEGSPGVSAGPNGLGSKDLGGGPLPLQAREGQEGP